MRNYRTGLLPQVRRRNIESGELYKIANLYHAGTFTPYPLPAFTGAFDLTLCFINGGSKDPVLDFSLLNFVNQIPCYPKSTVRTISTICSNSPDAQAIFLIDIHPERLAYNILRLCGYVPLITQI